jgi:hypothetical protein
MMPLRAQPDADRRAWPTLAWQTREVDDLPVVGAVPDRTHVGMICVPRQVDTAPGRSVVPMRVIR